MTGSDARGNCRGVVADHAHGTRTVGFRGHVHDNVAIIKVLDLDVLDLEEVRQQRIKGGTRVDLDVKI